MKNLNRIKQLFTEFWSWRIFLPSVCIGLIISLSVTACSAAYSDRVQGEIAAEVMRFHVLANSDSPADQALKLTVRDGILSSLSDLFTGGETLSETRKILEENLNVIEDLANEIIVSQGQDYTVSASLTKSYFPTRTYGILSLPAGTYETLRLEIGASEGRNWWCIMFPPLCMADVVYGAEVSETHTETPACKELANLLTAESYNILANTGKVKVKFKIVEVWQEIKNFFAK